ncbi:LLM class flavin-dependent oxidoreductase [Streptosporangium sp. NPDC006930]|uniref:LLM class flavin-dependent oxidoreductase n=1 Tax=unclassified Streptosporangium TaxID=2632669 RepID=UPI00341E4129
MSEQALTRLSVLDTSPVWRGASPTLALRESVAAAVHVERLGYHRYWVAEHHNARFIASCAPAVLAGQIAAATSAIRVGSGGVMLPNHAPLVVAEQFGTLEALHPGRVDLGIGRSPGTDMGTARALRRVSSPPRSGYFAEQVAEVAAYFEPDTGKDDRIVATPAQGNRPELWILGSSAENAELAGRLGLPYAFAYHIKPDQASEALAAYRAAFHPSAWLARPYTLITASVVAADTDERADLLAGPLAVVMHESLRGVRTHPNLGTSEAARYFRTPRERTQSREQLRTHIIGGPHTVRERAAELIAATGADELMAMSLVHEVEDRHRSYEILASAVTPRQPAGAAR